MLETYIGRSKFHNNQNRNLMIWKDFKHTNSTIEKKKTRKLNQKHFNKNKDNLKTIKETRKSPE